MRTSLERPNQVRLKMFLFAVRSEIIQNEHTNFRPQGATGNRLEALKADRAGQHSIRINDQFRVCFVWTPEGPVAVEITDYH